MEYVKINMDTHKVVLHYTEQEFQKAIESMIAVFEDIYNLPHDSQTKDHLAEFTEYYKDHLWLPGQQIVTTTNVYDSNQSPIYEKHSYQRPNIALARINYYYDHRKYIDVSYLTPASLYYDYHAYYHQVIKPSRYFWQQGRKHRNGFSIRSSNHFERYYAQLADTKYDRSLGQPPYRDPAGAHSNNKWEDWEWERRSEKANWKNQTKDRHQWQHNLDPHHKHHDISHYDPVQQNIIYESFCNQDYYSAYGDWGVDYDQHDIDALVAQRIRPQDVNPDLKYPA